MSWNVSAIGKASVVAEKVAAQFEAIHCEGPEEAIKNFVASAVVMALRVFPPGNPVKVYAQGWQTMVEGGALNSLNVGIEPIHGWQE